MKKYCTQAMIVMAVVAGVYSGEGWAKSPLAVGGKHDNKAPIEVTSDALEVLQAENKAIFTGHVVAIQGDTRLTADKMTIYYAAADDKKGDRKNEAGKKPATDSKSGGDMQGKIKKIEPEGHVFLSTPEETASGNNGVYDVEQQQIHLIDHVVLTRGKNILKGDKLDYNLATGKSQLNGGATSESPTSPVGRERVHALFIPGDEKSKTKAADSKKDSDNQ